MFNLFKKRIETTEVYTNEGLPLDRELSNIWHVVDKLWEEREVPVVKKTGKLPVTKVHGNTGKKRQKKCRECGFKAKTYRGLQIHKARIHNKK